MNQPERYFAYGSNMNPERVRERGLSFERVYGAVLPGYRLCFDKAAKHHAGIGHANIVFAPGDEVYGVVYELCDAQQICL
ncbi:MAG: gamma-glutamylcyclotransferase family protein, partial [Pseudomonadota bacterium]